MKRHFIAKDIFTTAELNRIGKLNYAKGLFYSFLNSFLAKPNSLAAISKWPFNHSNLIFKLPILSSAINILLLFISAGLRFQRKFFMISNVKRGHDICR